MSRAKVGDRVGAIKKADEKTVYLYGYGTYEGNVVPPAGTPGPFGDAHDLGIPNPKISLDNGKTVWGCQCWWAPEEQVKKIIGDRKVELVDA